MRVVIAGMGVENAVLGVVGLLVERGFVEREGEEEGPLWIRGISYSMILILLRYPLNQANHELLDSCLWVTIEPEDGNRSLASRRWKSGEKLGRVLDSAMRTMHDGADATTLNA
jgi:hypothetical protein